MLPIQLFRTAPELIKKGLEKKNFKDLSIVDKIVDLDAEKRKVQQAVESITAEINASSKKIGQMMASGQKSEAENIKNEVTQKKEGIRIQADHLQSLETQIFELITTIPNLPHSSVPEGITPEENEVVREHGDIPELFDGAVPHWEITKRHNLIDFELGTKITGSGFPVYIGKGAQLQRALVSYFLKFNTDAGYTEYLPPFMVNEASAFGTGQLPDKEGQMYFMPMDNFYMIPTSEVPLTNLFRDDIIPLENLPYQLTAYSPCFRREAGSYGKDVRGLNRLHQFEKVEIVQIVKAEESYNTLENMVLHVESLLKSLGLPYRLLRLCGGDMSFASALTYDFEVYSKAQERWLEVSSVSNFESFQTNRMKIRYKDDDGKMQLAHSLNGSSLALPRIVAALLENNQQRDGSIKLPQVLSPYMNTVIQ